jgi:hypothetical protein
MPSENELRIDSNLPAVSVKQRLNCIPPASSGFQKSHESTACALLHQNRVMVATAKQIILIGNQIPICALANPTHLRVGASEDRVHRDRQAAPQHRPLQSTRRCG